MEFVLSISCSNTFQNNYLHSGSVAGAGIALTLALHLYLKYIPVFSSCGYAPLLHGEKKI
jgi:hypothetical protein